ncbi:hypothetical protein DPMN_147878 [Dreissena polymorpha]|uniref:Uncharacterized protein n=1 Tax=Dreissena polymorpha TaxID=45954 RepID=A0A9D4IZP9_DREPO|nr:hypothetical protein DPMN_147878 [Dreissena polymorpha]
MRAEVESSSFGRVVQVRSVNYCIALLYSDVTDSDRVQRFCISFVIPLPRMRPSVFFEDINICSQDHCLAQHETDCSYEHCENHQRSFDKRLCTFPLCCPLTADSNKQILCNCSAQLQQRIENRTLPTNASANTQYDPPR